MHFHISVLLRVQLNARVTYFPPRLKLPPENPISPLWDVPPHFSKIKTPPKNFQKIIFSKVAANRITSALISRNAVMCGWKLERNSQLKQNKFFYLHEWKVQNVLCYKWNKILARLLFHFLKEKKCTVAVIEKSERKGKTPPWNSQIPPSAFIPPFTGKSRYSPLGQGFWKSIFPPI